MTKQEIANLDKALDDFLFALTLDMPDAMALEFPEEPESKKRWGNFLALKSAVRNLYLEARN